MEQSNDNAALEPSTLDVVTILADEEHVSSTPLNLEFTKNKS